MFWQSVSLATAGIHCNYSDRNLSSETVTPGNFCICVGGAGFLTAADSPPPADPCIINFCKISSHWLPKNSSFCSLLPGSQRIFSLSPASLITVGRGQITCQIITSVENSAIRQVEEMSSRRDLLDACAAGDIIAVRRAIANGVDPKQEAYDSKWRRTTPLHLACR